MLRLIKYLKPYLLLIVISIVLLFVQANADLALPDYLSRIVNNGIQQGGIENAVPVAIRQTEMEKLVLFMSEQDKGTVLGNYSLVEKDSPDFDEYVKEYPILASEPVYVLNPIDQEEFERLDPIFGKALLVKSFIQQLMDDPTRAAAVAQQLGLDLTKLPAGADLFTVISKLPASQLSMITGTIDQEFASSTDKMIIQMAVGVVKAEYVALGMDMGIVQNDYILRVGGLMLLVTLLSGASTIAVSFLAAQTAAGFGRDVRKEVFTKVENFSSTEFDRFSTASLITRSTNDITQIQMVVFMILRMVIFAPIMGVGGIIRALSKDTSMWWIIVVAVGILLTLILVVFSTALPKFKIIQNLIDRLNLVMRENLSGMMVIRAFNRQEFEVNRFDNANLNLTSTMLFINRVMVVMMPVMMLIMNGVSILIIWIGSHQVAEANMQVGDMIAFLQYTMQIVFSFLMLSMMFIILPRASVSAGRIADVLETEPVIKEPQEPRRFSEHFQGTIEFRNVSFRYPDAEEDVLHDISFIAKPGQTTAFIGSTGSGKSTIVNLIPRFYDVTGGSILVDNLDIREVSQHDLHDKIGYVPQKGVLFSGTIESNLRYADENASREAMMEAADIAQATEFISDNGNGFESEISQGGTNVSGGQKQRLSIARALVKKPPIYIFDDSFSAVDFKTDAALRRALKEKTHRSTLLIVTQRVSTIKTAEQIIVLEEGRVVGKGNHHELMQDCRAYQEIALSQLSQEELL
ncbi:MAG: ABC transporter [Chloroflexi bacterium RBG_13_48_10]|nr:MAG: ABC transporter [Chloroflexi bacterium RBG_13_48_10]